MNKKELAKLVYKHPMVKNLYKSSDKTVINKLIAEEVLREARGFTLEELNQEIEELNQEIEELKREFESIPVTELHKRKAIIKAIGTVEEHKELVQQEIEKLNSREKKQIPSNSAAIADSAGTKHSTTNKTDQEQPKKTSFEIGIPISKRFEPEGKTQEEISAEEAKAKYQDLEEADQIRINNFIKWAIKQLKNNNIQEQIYRQIIQILNETDVPTEKENKKLSKEEMQNLIDQYRQSSEDLRLSYVTLQKYFAIAHALLNEQIQKESSTETPKPEESKNSTTNKMDQEQPKETSFEINIEPSDAELTEKEIYQKYIGELLKADELKNSWMKFINFAFNKIISSKELSIDQEFRNLPPQIVGIAIEYAKQNNFSPTSIKSMVSGAYEKIIKPFLAYKLYKYKKEGIISNEDHLIKIEPEGKAQEEISAEEAKAKYKTLEEADQTRINDFIKWAIKKLKNNNIKEQIYRQIIQILNEADAPTEKEIKKLSKEEVEVLIKEYTDLKSTPQFSYVTLQKHFAIAQALLNEQIQKESSTETPRQEEPQTKVDADKVPQESPSTAPSKINPEVTNMTNNSENNTDQNDTNNKASKSVAKQAKTSQKKQPEAASGEAADKQTQQVNQGSQQPQQNQSHEQPTSTNTPLQNTPKNNSTKKKKTTTGTDETSTNNKTGGTEKLQDVLNQLEKATNQNEIESILNNLLTTQNIDESVYKEIKMTDEGWHFALKSEDKKVFLIPAISENTPHHVFASLLDKQNDDINHFLSQNNKAPPNVLDALAKKEKVKNDAKINIIKNPSTSIETIDYLKEYGSNVVKSEASKKFKERQKESNNPIDIYNSQILPKYKELNTEQKWGKELENAILEDKEVETILKINDNALHLFLAKNENIKPQYLEKLYEMYKKAGYDILINLAGNPNTPAGVLYNLIKITTFNENEKITETALETLLKKESIDKNDFVIINHFIEWYNDNKTNKKNNAETVEEQIYRKVLSILKEAGQSNILDEAEASNKPVSVNDVKSIYEEYLKTIQDEESRNKAAQVLEKHSKTIKAILGIGEQPADAKQQAGQPEASTQQTTKTQQVNQGSPQPQQKQSSEETAQTDMPPSETVEKQVEELNKYLKLKIDRSTKSKKLLEVGQDSKNPDQLKALVLVLINRENKDIVSKLSVDVLDTVAQNKNTPDDALMSLIDNTENTQNPIFKLYAAENYLNRFINEEEKKIINDFIKWYKSNYSKATERLEEQIYRKVLSILKETGQDDIVEEPGEDAETTSTESDKETETSSNPVSVEEVKSIYTEYLKTIQDEESRNKAAQVLEKHSKIINAILGIGEQPADAEPQASETGDSEQTSDAVDTDSTNKEPELDTDTKQSDKDKPEASVSSAQTAEQTGKEINAALEKDDKSPPAEKDKFAESYKLSLDGFFGFGKPSDAFMKQVLLRKQSEKLLSMISTLDGFLANQHLAYTDQSGVENVKQPTEQQTVKSEGFLNRFKKKSFNGLKGMSISTYEDEDAQLVEVPTQTKAALREELISLVDSLKHLKTIVDRYSEYSEKKSMFAQFDGSNLKNVMNKFIKDLQIVLAKIYKDLNEIKTTEHSIQEESKNFKRKINEQDAKQEFKAKVEKVKDVYGKMFKVYKEELKPTLEGDLDTYNLEKARISAENIKKLATDEKFISLFPQVNYIKGNVVNIDDAMNNVQELIEKFIETARDIALWTKTGQDPTSSQVIVSMSKIAQISTSLENNFGVKSFIDQNTVQKAEAREAKKPEKQSLTTTPIASNANGDNSQPTSSPNADNDGDEMENANADSSTGTQASEQDKENLQELLINESDIENFDLSSIEYKKDEVDNASEIIKQVAFQIIDKVIGNKSNSENIHEGFYSKIKDKYNRHLKGMKEFNKAVDEASFKITNIIEPTMLKFYPEGTEEDVYTITDDIGEAIKSAVKKAGKYAFDKEYINSATEQEAIYIVEEVAKYYNEKIQNAFPHIFNDSSYNPETIASNNEQTTEQIFNEDDFEPIEGLPEYKDLIWGTFEDETWINDFVKYAVEELKKEKISQTSRNNEETSSLEEQIYRKVLSILKEQEEDDHDVAQWLVSAKNSTKINIDKIKQLYQTYQAEDKPQTYSINEKMWKSIFVIIKHELLGKPNAPADKMNTNKKEEPSSKEEKENSVNNPGAEVTNTADETPSTSNTPPVSSKNSPSPETGESAGTKTPDTQPSSSADASEESEENPANDSVSSHNTQNPNGTETEEEKIQMAKNQKTSQDVLETLANDPSYNVKTAVAFNPNTHDDVLEQLLKYDNGDFALSIGISPNTPEELLRKMAKIEDVKIKAAAAINPKIPVDVLTKLANDKSEGVRRYVAKNQKTPHDVLETLANDTSEIVRAEVARNSNTPEDALKTLAKDQDSSVRQAVASNSNTPEDALKTLANDDEEENVKSQAKQNLNSIKEKIQMAKNQKTSQDVLETLANDKKYLVRMLVAVNPSTHEDVLRKLAKDQDSSVRQAVAENPNTPADTLETLANDPSEIVSSQAKKNLKKRNKTNEASEVRQNFKSDSIEEKLKPIIEKMLRQYYR